MAQLDRQIAPMEHEDGAAGAGGGGLRDAGRELLDAQVAHERQQYQPTAAEKFFAVVKSMIMRGLVIYFFMSMFKRPQAPPTPQGAGNDPSMAPYLPRGGAATNLFQNGTEFDLYVYLSENQDFSEFSNPGSLVWKKKRLVYEDWYSGESGDGCYTFSTEFPISERLKSNGSIYMHTYIVKSGKSPDPSAGKELHSKKWTLYKMKQLNKFKKKSYRKTANLLTGETEASEVELAKLRDGIQHEIVSHWHPNITINIVFDYTNWVPGQVPPPIDEFVEFTPSLQNYKPIMYINNYWNMNKDYSVINGSVEKLNLTVTYQPLSMFRWQMYSAQEMQNKFNILAKVLGEENVNQDDDEADSLKEALLETNFYLLVLTFIVSLVHSVFEFLAFKNDIQFWNNRQSLEGLSVKSVFFNVFQSLIVLLYVLDNETNTIIKISCFARIVIELWKINKVMDVSFDREKPKFLGIFPRLKFADKGNYEESGTKEYDNMAFKYLGALLFPLAIGYCIYSVVYNEHKGWYSFILSSSYGFLLTFGFIMMTPQLFINYKLKSVAHLPWRMMTYKALNTFIDDIFAFVIKMPTMYRIGCFRDDIIFFIFLYQRYIYRVDHSRLNEFGFSGDMLQEAERKKLDGSHQQQSNGEGVALKAKKALKSGDSTTEEEVPKKTEAEKKTD